MTRAASPLTIAFEEEIGNEALFTGRQEEMDYFLDWADLVLNKLGRSHVILARKRRGKTALVQRFFNTLYTRNNPKVIPFYFRVPEEAMTMIDYARLFFKCLLSQYLGFKLRKPEFIGTLPLGRDKIRDLIKDDDILLQLFDKMELHCHNRDRSAAWRLARQTGHEISERKDERIIQIIDEFQFLNEYMYTDDTFSTRQHMASPYQETGSSRVSPQIITGSYVGWLTEIVNHMVGRFKHYYLGPLPDDEASACVFKYANAYRKNVTDESAVYLAAACHNDPYYIASLFQSGPRNLDLTSAKNIRTTLDAETTEGGEIANMWLEYIYGAFARINDLAARKIVLYLAHHEPKQRTRAQLKKDLAMNDVDLEDRLAKLVYADLIRFGTTRFDYQGLGDPLFSMVFRKLYQKEIDNVAYAEILTDIETELKSVRGLAANYKGEAAENRVAKKLVFMPINEVQPATVFIGTPDDLSFDVFSSAHKHVFQLPGGDVLEVDIYCRSKNPRGPDLVVEVKDWEHPPGVPEIDKFIEERDSLLALLQRPTWFLFYSERPLGEDMRKYLLSNQICYSDGKRMKHL